MANIVKLIEENSLHVTGSGFEIKAHLNWYRSLPLSCVEKVAVYLDGEVIDPLLTSICVNEREHVVDQLEDLVDEIWFVQDAAVVRVNLPGMIHVGEEHRIDLEITLRAPYIKVGPDRFLTMPARDSVIQTAA